jgi:hypothetical protein
LGAWLKLFTDGTKESGSDQEIKWGQASWSNGRLDGIEEVRLFLGRFVCCLIVPDTTWHQFDRFIAAVAEGKQSPYRTHRVLQAKICAHHLGQYVMCSNSGGYYFWAIVGDKKDCFFIKQITEHHIDRWVTIVLPSRGFPYMNFSDKGKMNNDHQYIPR